MREVPVAPPDYRDPWDLSFAARSRMLRAEGVRVAYYYRSPDASTFRYRCYNTAMALNELVPGVSASWFHEADGHALLDLVKDVDVLVVCRVPYSDQVAQLMSVARRFGTRVLVDVDDYVFDLAIVPEVVKTLDQYEGDPAAAEHMWNWWFAYFARVRQTMELADEVIVTNDFLAARTREVLDQPVRVIPNFMGAEQIAYSQELVHARDAAGDPDDGTVHLGYFSGTPTHNRDLALAAGALARLMRRDESVRLRLVGFLDLTGSPLGRFTDRIDQTPLTDYLDLQRLIAEVDLSLAPLQDNRFTNCKSELKYFDAAAVAVASVASPTYTMSAAIEHGVTGLLSRVDEWDVVLAEAVRGRRTAGREMGRRAYEHAIAAYSPAAMVDRVSDGLGLTGR
ncbi:glycosyltransferase [Cellulomonas sp. RIT-PI-Y]|jgi:glycosyltransferase involved in cell wall biosynthesis|uniref:glycosyltransferase n=1 Tax=Cellulomonas sp. RIT-PI-Y TaxID=3035297 RepID=UPI0021DAB23C|nr:glycosyltransferase [Cellulomonas sp. RIT-PI-Y]